MQQINENKVQFALSDLQTYLGLRARNQTPTTAIMTYIDAPTIGIVSNEPINSPNELSGKSWGVVTYSAGRALLPLILEANGIDPKTVTIELMDVSVLYPSLFERKIDSAEAHITGTLPSVMLGAEKAGKKVYFTSLSDWGLKGYSRILIARDDVIQSDPSLVRRVAAAILKSTNEARENASDDEILNLILKAEPQISRPEAQLQWTQFKQVVKKPGAIDPQIIEANLTYLAETQNLRTDLRPEQLFTTAFVPTP
jgi:ABC-type nitrate/sulfonate/bicarbonate transport system substrate-binding protein